MKNKVVLLGSAGVGKTSFLLAATRQFQNFRSDGILPYQATIGAGFVQLQTYTDDRGKVVHVCRPEIPYEGIRGPKIDIWDTAGQERYNALLPMYTRGALVAVVMHEGTPRSVLRAKEETIRIQKEDPSVKIYVVQTKSDTGVEFDYKLVDDIDAVGWSYICTIKDDLSSVDGALLGIARLAIESIPEEIPDEDIIDQPPHVRSCTGSRCQ